MSNIIDSIQLSGTVYTLSAQTSGGNPTVELTQAQYDALVTAGTVQQDTYYIITDAQAGDLTNYYTKSETNTLLGGKADTATTYTKTETDNAITAATSTKQDTLVSGTNIKTINNTSILGSGNIDIQGGGGGKAIEAGRGISITTGETADTVSFNLPISAGTGSNSIICNHNNNKATGSYSFAGGQESSATSFWSFAYGANCKANYGSWAGGYQCLGNGSYSFAIGERTKTSNDGECAVGSYNASNTGSTNADNTLFSVGNGTADNARHNAFEIRQNGDIYITSGGTDIKLQDNLGGGGSSYTAGDGIDITNDVISVTGKVDTSTYNTYTAATDAALASKADTATTYTKTEVDTALSGYVTTDTLQDITAQKTFVGDPNNSKKSIKFKQHDNASKVGFVVVNSASTNNELASFELRPNTFTIDNVQHPLLYFGHYRTTNIANAGVPQTVIGFRQYDQSNAAAYHYLIPLPEKAKTPFSLTTSFKDYYAPMGFKNGSTMITADDTGVVDLSSELGGLKLKKLTQAEYDALVTKDNSTLYVIVN